jgi:hypothetical protein
MVEARQQLIELASQGGPGPQNYFWRVPNIREKESEIGRVPFYFPIRQSFLKHGSSPSPTGTSLLPAVAPKRV